MSLTACAVTPTRAATAVCVPMISTTRFSALMPVICMHEALQANLFLSTNTLVGCFDKAACSVRTMSTVGERVAKAREKAGLNQTQLAKMIKVTAQAIQHLEASPTATSRYLIAISRALKVSPEWLESGKGRMEDVTAPNMPVVRDNLVEIGGADFACLPVYDIRFAAGAGSVNEDETPIDHHLISMSLLRSLTDAPLDKIGMFQAAGDSMEPTIQNRDWVCVDMRLNRLVNPGIYAIVFEGEGLLKRVSRHLENGTVTLISDNKRYEPQTLKKPERLHVVGRVILSIRRH